MIKITRGFYGVNRLSSKSGPVSLSEAEEKRLVSLGVAEYVSVPETPARGNDAENADKRQEAPGALSDTDKAVKPAKTAKTAGKTATKGKAAKK